MPKRLYKAVKRTVSKDIYPFHMPGHKGGRGMQSGVWFPEMDLTEVPGLDNLHAPHTSILKAQQKMAQLFGAEECYFLVNGSSVGIMAAILATVGNGENIIVSRNAHISVFNGLTLSGANPIYVYPEILPHSALVGGVRPHKIKVLFHNNPIKAVHITSPTFEGFTSDIRTFADIAHQNGAILIVDEAHGAHFAFHDRFPQTALSQGADIVIQSHHKTLMAPGQGACLFTQGARVDKRRLQQALSLLQTTSPSYFIMSGLDYCAMMLEKKGTMYFERYVKRLVHFREKAQSLAHMHLVGNDVCNRLEPELELGLGISELDIGKLVFTLPKSGVTGYRIEKKLRKKHRIQMELSAPNHFIGMTSYADTDKGFRRLYQALCQIERNWPTKTQRAKCAYSMPKPPVKALTPAQAYANPAKMVPLDSAIGCIAANCITPYPPGIPSVAPGEIITDQAVAFIHATQAIGGNILGVTANGLVAVLRDKL